jgi:thymidylate synthase
MIYQPTIVGRSFDEVYPQLIRLVWEHGEPSKPRNMPIRELLGVKFVIEDANLGYCSNRHRKLNQAFGIVERWEYVLGDSSPSRIGFYNKNFLNFLNEETGKFDGAYAPRLRRQYEYVLDLLKRDPDTRQAVLNVNAEIDQRISKDVPCTISLQLLLRGGKLNMIATMRSNDLLWGTPYDVSGFTFIQQCFASWLGVPVGYYVHQAGSLHIYESTWDSLCPVAENAYESDGYTRRHWSLGFSDTMSSLAEAMQHEQAARLGHGPIPPGSFRKCLIDDLGVVVMTARRKRQSAT